MSKGSHATFSEDRWEPKLCSGCGERVTLSGKSNFEHGGAIFRFGPPAESWHADCKERERSEQARS